MPYALLLAYLLGSIPFGLILTRMAGLGDIRQLGSGNIGATNVMRTGRKKLGIATLLLDAGKGWLAVMLAVDMGADDRLVFAAAAAAVLGHVFSVWLKFKGGKGVATALGALFALYIYVGLVVCLAWLVIFFAFRYVSLASIGCFWVVAIGSLPTGDHLGQLFLFFLAALITWTHRSNIARLRAGTENRFGKKAV